MSKDVIQFQNAIDLVKSVLDNFPAFILVVNCDGEIIYNNNDAKNMLGENITGYSISYFFSEEEISKNFKPKNRIDYEIQYESKYYKLSDVDIVWVDGELSRLIIGMDITDIKTSEARFKKCATMDAMTGIYNRQVGIDYLIDYIEQLKCGGDIFTVCYIDINDLKLVNDSFGHSEGDIYILSIVNIIKATIRQTDIFARMGGDEFLILFYRCPYKIVENIMQTIMCKINLINESSKGKGVFYSISYGVMEINTETILDPEFILNSVDNKMYYMKDEYKQLKKIKKRV